MRCKKQILSCLFASLVSIGLSVTHVPAQPTLNAPVITIADGPQPPPPPPSREAGLRVFNA
jgi:hypothetical protein